MPVHGSLPSCASSSLLPHDDVAVLQSVLDGKPLPLAAGYDLTGKWSCRTLKLGGALLLIAYPHFKCLITDDGAGWTLQKLTDSQRTEGRFLPRAIRG
jgi:Domain of unknown function (DUF4893)